MVRQTRWESGYRGLVILLALASLALGLGGCDEGDYAAIVTAVHPFYTPQDVTSDADLAGTWLYFDSVNKDGESEDGGNASLRFTFTPVENNSYTVIVEETDSGKHFSSRFEGHLFRLGAESFLDLYPASIQEGSAFYFLHFFPCHTVMRIDFRGGRLEMTFLSASWLAKQIKSGAVGVTHANSDDILLLTATTQEMQEVLFLNANDENAFAETLRFDRAGLQEEQ